MKKAKQKEKDIKRDKELSDMVKEIMSAPRLSDHVADSLSSSLQTNSSLQKSYEDAYKALEAIQHSYRISQANLEPVYEFFRQSQSIVGSWSMQYERSLSFSMSRLTPLIDNQPLLDQFGEVVEFHKQASIDISDWLQTTLGSSVASLGNLTQLGEEYMLTTTTIEHKEVGQVHFELTQKVDMRLGRVEDRIIGVDEKVDKLLEEKKETNDMLEEMMTYVKSGGKVLVPIENLTFETVGCELIINDRRVSIKPDTNQYEICRVLVSDLERLKSGWDVEDILLAIDPGMKTLIEGDGYEQEKKKVENAVRHLSDKIHKDTQYSKFFLYTSHTVMLNPKYSGL